ncbi:hypothetical protein TNCV_1703351 [Trichonephila clavipes]|nr:hypothetical protein TNCV_1703351 [Trichonephila clavipes]
MMELGILSNPPKEEDRLTGDVKMTPLVKIISLIKIVRVHYFVRGGFAGNHSRASSKHLSPSSSGRRARFLGVKKGWCCTCKLHVWLSGLQRNRPDVDVFEK